MTVLRFSWSAMCSANTTKATGANRASSETKPVTPLSALVPSFNAVTKVNSGSAIKLEKVVGAKLEVNAVKSMILRYSISHAWPMKVKIAART